MRISEDCKSEWGDIPAGVPQDTKLGPWLFILMTDEIDVANTELWKYVDDTTIAERVAKNQASRIQASVNELVTKSGPYAGFFCQGGKRVEGPYIFKYGVTLIPPNIFKVK